MHFTSIFIVGLVLLLSVWALAGTLTWILFEWYDGRAWRRIQKKRLAQLIPLTRRRRAWSAPRSTQIPYSGDRA